MSPALSTRFAKTVPWVVLMVLLYFPLFQHLDVLALRLYDESRLAINALEMLGNKNLIVTHYEGKPDMWNTKPPLMVWIQALFIQLMGPGELAVRLPSALAGFFTCMMLVYFSASTFNSIWPGFFAALILASSSGFVGIHTTRTGDYDALLTLFTTASCLFFYKFVTENRQGFLHLFFLSLTLGVLTKSIASLLFLPFMAIFLLHKKQWKMILSARYFYLDAFLFALVVLAYYLLREYQNPGYLRAVAANELGGRYLHTIEYHSESFWYYFNNLYRKGFSEWYLLLPFGIAAGYFSIEARVKSLVSYLLLLVFGYLLVISCAQTKLEWYAMPVYPLLAMLCAQFVFLLFRLVQSIPVAEQLLKVNFLPYAFAFFVFSPPYGKIIDATYFPEEHGWDKNYYAVSYLLREAIRGEFPLENRYFVCRDYNPQNMFYLHALQHKGVDIRLKKMQEVSPGDTVLLFEPPCRDYIQKHFVCKKIHQKGNAEIYAILR